MTRHAALDWVEELRSRVPSLRSESEPRPYWSQKRDRPAVATASDLMTTVTRCRSVISELESEHWFARTLGFECVDGHGESNMTLADVLERRVGKPQLADLASERWSEDDLCDFVEVLHDISARPSRGWHHSYGGCGWHPSAFDRSSGQALYRWRINRVFKSSALMMRMADEGEDVGRVVRVLPSGLDELALELADVEATGDASVPHAIMLFAATPPPARTGTLR